MGKVWGRVGRYGEGGEVGGGWEVCSVGGLGWGEDRVKSAVRVGIEGRGRVLLVWGGCRWEVSRVRWCESV